MKTIIAMKKSLAICIVFCWFLSYSANAQEEKVKTSTTTTTTVTQETIVGDSVVKPQQPVEADKDRVSDDAVFWEGFHIGAIGQATFTDIKVDGNDGRASTSYVVGYGGGGFIGYFFNRHVEIRLEALYSSLAQKIKEDNVERELNLSYINFPLLLALHTGYDKTVSFNITAGPQIGINTGSSLEGSGSDGIDTIKAAVDVKAADLGIAYGAGLDFGFGPEKLVHLNVGFRGVYGLVDISDNSRNITTNEYYLLDRAKLKTYSGYAGLSVKF